MGSVLVVAGLLLGLTAPASAQIQDVDPSEVRAQDASPPHQGARAAYYHNPKAEIPGQLRERLSEKELDQLQRRRERIRKALAEAKDESTIRPKAIAGIPERGADQSWAPNENPNPALNFSILGTPEYAGDVDGDGTNDYIYSGFARDERTSELEDQTGKAALFLGGTPEDREDQLWYTDLTPVGDLNDDGYDDAVAYDSEIGEYRIYTGSDSGYQESDASVDLFGSVVRGFTDLDDDGYQDVVFGNRYADYFFVVYGASDLDSVTRRVYQPNNGNEYFTYAVGNLDGSGSAGVVRFTSNSYDSGHRLQVFSIDNSSRDLVVEQDAAVDNFNQRADQLRMAAVDVNGNGELEIVAPVYYATFLFERGSTTPYQETPTVLSDSEAMPVGDLDEDGRHDFVVDDPSSDAQYIAYGPSDLDNQLTLDAEISTIENASQEIGFTLYGGLGDVTGDGSADAVLYYEDNAARTVGRRFVSVDASDRSVESPTDVTYPRDHFYDQINETQAIGDFNADGTTDFAVVRSGIGRVDIFYGGSSISQTPDLTVDPPVDSLFAVNVSSGDFDGDGTSDLLVGYDGPTTFDGLGVRNDIYFGGDNPDATSDHSILADDVGFRLSFPRKIGDVNDDGADDWMAADRGFTPDDTTQHVGVFFGGSTLPSTPDETIEYPEDNYLGEVSAAVGDFNGDGIDDFAFNNTVDRSLDVYFGGSNPSFDRPADRSIPTQSTYFGIAAGDFNGDGTADIATKPGASQENAAIRIFHGGADADVTADQRLLVPVATRVGFSFDEDGYANYGYGPLQSPGDVDGNGADELIVGSGGFGSTNAILYRPSVDDEPSLVLRAPNQDAGLGSQQFIYSAATGDFNDDGTADFIATQYDDNNDAARSSRVYRYRIDGFERGSEVVYVDKDATGDSTGTSWTDAYTDLQTAIDDAAATDEIWIAEGTYTPNPDYEGDRSATFRITGAWDGLEVYGGFSGGETLRDQRNADANEVVLSGDLGVESDTSDNALHVLTLDGTVAGTITTATVIDGVTITDGVASDAGFGARKDDGGGMLCKGSGAENECSPTLRNVVFRGNTADYGGAVFLHGDDGGEASPVFENVTFVDNFAYASGGGIYNGGTRGVSSPTFQAVVFRQNEADFAAAMYNDGSDGVSRPQIEEVRFAENSATFWGGALFNSGDDTGESNPQIRGATFVANEAGFGAAIYNDGIEGEASPSISGTTFRANAASTSGAIFNDAGGGGEASPRIMGSMFVGNEAEYGAAVYNDGANAGSSTSSRLASGGIPSLQRQREASTGENASDGGAVSAKTSSSGPANPHILNTSFRGNVADSSGGALYNNGFDGVSRPHLTNVTIAGNEAKYGGALYNDARSSGTAEPQVENTILWDNAAPNGPTVFNNSTGADPEFRHSILEGSGGSGSGWVDSLGTDNGGNLDADPLFAAAAGPDGTWGTEDDDVRLQGPGSPVGPSPAIDAGDNEVLSSDVSEDLGGETRRQDVEDAADSGNGSAPIVDIGAYESDGAAQVEYVAESQTVDDDGTYEYTESGCVFSFSGTSNSGSVVAERFGSAPVDVSGIVGRLLDARLVVRVEGDLAFDSTDVAIDVSTLPVDVDPSKLVMYRRGTVGEGDFTELATSYDADANELTAKVATLGEFVVVIDAPPAPTSLASTLGEGEISLDWQAPDASGLAKYYLYRSLSPIASREALADMSPVDSVDGSTTSYVDSAVDPGTTYYYRITAVDDDGVEGALSDPLRVFLYPQTVTADVSRSFEDASGPGDYRLVALPGRVDTSLAQTLSGEDGAEWQAYWDDGSEQDYLVQFDGSDTFRFEAGNGFWVTSREAWTHTLEVSTVKLAGDTAAVVDVHEGWNIISNPLGKGVYFPAIDAANDGVLQPFWSFSGGSFGAPDTVASAQTGRAYYFYNDDASRDSLVIPYPGAPGSTAKTATQAADEAPMLALSARPAGAEKAARSTVRFGIDEGATEAVGDEDLIAPPGRFEQTSLRIKAPTGSKATEQPRSKRARYLMAEQRPPAVESGGHTFTLRLASRADGPIQLSAQRLQAVKGSAVALLHPASGKTYDLREQSSVTITPDGKKTELKVAVGTEEYVEGQKSDVLPKKVRLTSYPNPMAGQGTIEYALPEESKVTLRIYDVLGRKVATIAGGRKDAGRHTVQIETDQLSSGVYFGRLQAGDRTITQKITVVR